MPRLGLLTTAALFGLAACTGVQITTPPVPYTASKELGARGSSSFTVSTYRRVQGEREQIKGVPCSFAGDGFSSSFESPAVVLSPNMQGRTSVASVTCTLDGVSKTKTIEPFNETISQINQSMRAGGIAGGLVGVLVGGAVAAVQADSRDPAQDVYGYRDVAIDF
jgi:hypothetical protein